MTCMAFAGAPLSESGGLGNSADNSEIEKFMKEKVDVEKPPNM